MINIGSIRNALRILKGARALVVKGWAKHSYALDKNDEPVPATNKDAVKFCLSGAVYRGWRDIGCGPTARVCVDTIIDQVAGVYSGESSAVTFNDAEKTTKKDILKVIDRAARLARKIPESA